MKKFGKILIVVLALTTIVGACFAFTACNKEGDNNTLSVSTNCEFDPFEYKDDSGNPVGIDMDIAAALADKLGMQLKITDMPFDSVVSDVASGNSSIAMAGLTVTNERKQSVDFTQTYFSSSQVVIAKNGNDILDIEFPSDDTDEAAIEAAKAAVEAKLSGKRIGVQNGTTGYSYVSGDSDDYEGIGATAVGFTSGALAVQALLNNSVDFVIIDKVPATKLVAANQGLTVSSVILTGEDYAFAVKKGNTEFLGKVNAAMTELINDGTIERIFQEYGISSGLNG